MEVLWNYICGIDSSLCKNKEQLHQRDMCDSSLFEFFTMVLACGRNLGVDMHTHTGGVGRNF